MAPERDLQTPAITAGLSPNVNDNQRELAAGKIQRTYRGHRTRRQLDGFGLDPSTRWLEAVRDAQYQKLTTPTPRPNATSQEGYGSSHQSHATEMHLSKQQWYRAMQIARRAGADDRSPSVSDCSSDGVEHKAEPVTSDERKEQDRREQARAVQKKTAKMMDLQYFLEMVDQKHRYGSNLRKYHNYWKSHDTNQNFFYWLDLGDGKDVELPECSRSRLDKEQVRYLSREERLNYMVKVHDGFLVWAKNGERVWTKDDLYRDSLKGIVPTSNPTPEFHYNVPPPGQEEYFSSEDSEEEQAENIGADEGERYVNEAFDNASGPQKIKHVSAAVAFNHMIRTSLRKGHKWIFVAGLQPNLLEYPSLTSSSDTSYRLYVGYKQSGSFQHSSFLHGSRITAAGLIKIKDGQLRSLSPLSGHYRPPAHNFRLFVENLRDQGVDMSRVSISKSYAVLIGMESYTRTRERIEGVEGALVREKDRALHPAKVRERDEASQDKSQSAKKERQYLKNQQIEQDKSQGQKRHAQGIPARLSKSWRHLVNREVDQQAEKKENHTARLPGTGPEDGIPAPEGER